MEWRIFKRSYHGAYIDVDFELTPPNEPFYYLIRSTALYRLPLFIQQVILSGGFNNEKSCYLPYSAMDWEDKEGSNAREGDVEAYDEVSGTSVLKETEVRVFVYDYGRKMLEVYNENEKVQRNYADFTESQRNSIHPETAAYFSDFDPDWGFAMQQVLQRLQEKL